MRLSSVWRFSSVVLLALAAVVLLSLGAPAKEALAGAGFAFIGAALTRGVDLAKERRGEAEQTDVRRRRDLDETRRLAYMALVVGTAPGRPELVATIMNALAHHGSAVDPEIAARHVTNVVNGTGGESERWLREQIERITVELGS